jgi:Tfp pilus assembly protein PilF
VQKLKISNPIVNTVPYLALGVFVLALIVRLVYLLQVRHTPVLDFFYIDSEYYHNWAVSIARGDLLGGTKIFFAAPFYAYFLALIYRVLGSQYLAALLIQIVIGSFSCVLLFRIAQKYFDQRTAVLAGAIAAVYPVFIFYDAMLLKENLMVFFTLLFIVLYARGSRRALFLAGVCVGINALMRPTIFLILPFLVAYDFFKYRSAWLKRALLIGAGIIVTIFPVALRNRVVGGEWVVTVASGGMNFWTGNNAQASGAYVGAPFVTSEELQYESEDFRREASKRSGRELTIDETSSFWYREGLRFITGNPAKFAWVLWRKFVAFWHDTELPSDLNFYLARDFSGVLQFDLLTFGIIVPFAVLGIVQALRKKNSLNFLLLTLAGSNLLASLIFFNSSRYRLPVVPVFILYAGFAVSEIIRFYEEKNVNALKFLLIILPVFFFANYRDTALSRIAWTRVSYLNAASYYMRSCIYDKAEVMLKKCLELDPTYPLAYQKYAALLLATGRPEHADEFLAKSLQYSAIPGNQRAFRAMPELKQGYLLFAEKKYNEALSLFQQVLKEHPETEKELDNNIGLCYMRLGDYKNAEEVLLRTIQINPGYDKAYYNAGILYRKMGDNKKAKEYFKKALLANPANAKAKLRLQD